MKRNVIVLLLGMILSWPALAVDGLLQVVSTHSVEQTTDRLEAALTEAGFRIFARVDHGAGARSVDLELPPTQLLIFGKPKAGTVLMQRGRTIGIDLPLKYLVWADEGGKVSIAWNDPNWLAQRHGVDGADQVRATIGKALRGFAERAAGS